MAQSRTDITFGDLGSGFQIGMNSGPIHLPPERPETPPSPSSTVRFPRDPDYVDRQALLERVRAKCSIPASRTALVGLGGVGKSQLAIEYAYQNRDRLPDTWVFWVYASNAARLEQSYREIADHIKIAGRKDPKVNIFKLVHDWLCTEKNETWLLILDNVDDARFLYEAPTVSHDGPGSGESGTSRQPLLAYLPQSPNGSILLTTRTREVALKLVEQRDIITVEPMDEAHAVTLLEKKLGVRGDGNDIAELAGALEFMPLAIVQAASYISQRAPRSSARQYLEEFRKSDRKMKSLLSHEAGHLRRDWEAKNSIIITWQISFDYICQVRPSAADLLSLMSFFDWQGIPEDLVQIVEGIDYESPIGLDLDNGDDSSLSTWDDGFEDDILTLRNYLFISVNADNTTFGMHRLVQLAMREWLIVHGQLERWKQRFINILAIKFPSGEYENWERCQSIFPHAKLAVSQRPDEKGSLHAWAFLLRNAASYALSRGNMDDAEEMSEQAMNTGTKLFGQEHKETLRSKVILALAYSDQGRWKDSEKLFVEVLETSKRLFGADHPTTLISMGNLATAYSKQGRWDDAEELEVLVQDTSKRVLGEEHPDTLTSMGNLATTYSRQGRWDNAEKVELHVLEMRKRILGPRHPSTLAGMNNLALTYIYQGRWSDAEVITLQVLERSNSVLGTEHPNTLATMRNLAIMYRNQGRLDKAEELFLQVLEARKRVLGAEHQQTLISMRNLASTYRNLDRWDEAEELEVQALEIEHVAFAAEHPDTMSRMSNIAFALKSQGRDIEALKMMEECIKLQGRVLGIDHPDTLSSSEILSRWQAEQF